MKIIERITNLYIINSNNLLLNYLNENIIKKLFNFIGINLTLYDKIMRKIN